MEELTSVVSYPQRDRRFGRNSYRGNCDGRLLLSLIRQYKPRRIADPTLGSGTSKDVSNFVRSKGYEHDFFGADLKEGFDLLTDPVPSSELVFAHFPYWDIIKYSDDPRDLSASQDFSTFAGLMKSAIAHLAESLVTGGRLAVLIGDVRKKGVYYPLVRHVLDKDNCNGLKLRSVIVKLQHNVKSGSKRYGRLEDPRILHEYLVLFKKL